jgi:hypothetical protein
VRLDIDLWHRPEPTATGFAELPEAVNLLQTPAQMLGCLAGAIPHFSVAAQPHKPAMRAA